MINVNVVNNNISIQLNKCWGELFTRIKALLKTYKFKWNPETNSWEGSVFKFDEIRAELEEYDTVHMLASEDSIQKLRVGSPELIINKERALVDYSLLRYPPITGKTPYENFQRIDIASGLTRNRYAYFLGMGTGKSYIAAALIAHYYIKWNRVGKILIITTNIGVRNFQHELFKFIKNLDSNKLAIGGVQNREPFQPHIDIVLLSYSGWRVVCNHYKKLKKITATSPRKPFLPLEEWANTSSHSTDMMLILDESHNIAIPSSQQSRLTVLHAPLFKYRYLFTGTPADKPEKLYNQLKILDPALVHRLNYTEWLGEYAELGTRFSKFAIRTWKKHKLEELNKRFIAAYGIYRNSEDILDLPTHYIKKIYISMSKEHRSIYEEFVINVLDDLKDHGNSSTRDIVNKFPYMMLAIENPFLLEKHIDKFNERLKNQIRNFKEHKIEKLIVLKEILEEQKNNKGIIWVVHPKTAEMIARHVQHLNPIIITGVTNVKLRDELITEFKTKAERKILIANIHVLNTSITITEATWQCYMERLFNYTPYEQSSKRIYRLGQNKVVTTYIPIYNNSLDMLLDRNLDTKDSLVKGLMSKDFLTQEEWKKIFNFSEHDKLALI